MSFLIYPLIFFIFPYCATSSHTYRIIRNATIKLPFTISTNDGHKSTWKNCTDCLCEAYGQSHNISLFTCTQDTSNVICQFYYFMPKRDEIYVSQNTSIYVMKNETFEEKDDCCNTTFLVDKINTNSTRINFTGDLRFLIFGHNNTIVTLSSEILHRIDRSPFQLVKISNIKSVFRTVGYSDGKYYFDEGQNIIVYDETLTSPSLYRILLSHGELTTIRFLNETQMLVGTDKGGAYICEKKTKTENFTKCSMIPGTKIGQVHGFGVVNNDTFYVGWEDDKIKKLHLYTRDPDGSWKENGTIIHNGRTTDIVFDRCNRVWAVNADQNQIFIYDQNTSVPNIIIVNNQTFNLLILEDYNYTLITSHHSHVNSYIQPFVNCRPVRPKYNRD